MEFDLSKFRLKPQPNTDPMVMESINELKEIVHLYPLALSLMECYARDVRNLDTFIATDLAKDHTYDGGSLEENIKYRNGLYNFSVALAQTICKGKYVSWDHERKAPIFKYVGVKGNGIFSYLSYVDGKGITPEEAIKFIQESEFTLI